MPRLLLRDLDDTIKRPRLLLSDLEDESFVSKIISKLRPSYETSVGEEIKYPEPKPSFEPRQEMTIGEAERIRAETPPVDIRDVKLTRTPYGFAEEQTIPRTFEEQQKVKDVAAEKLKPFTRVLLEDLEPEPIEKKGILPVRMGKEFVKGAARGIESVAASVGTSATFLGESVKNALDKSLIPLTGDPEKDAEIKRINESVRQKVSGQKLAKKITDYGKYMDKWWINQAVKGWEAPSQEALQGLHMDNFWVKSASLIGEAVPSLGVAAMVSIASGNPVPAMAVLGGMEGLTTYKEAREAGKSHRDSSGLFAASAIGSAVLEYFPLDFMMKGGTGKILSSMVIASLEEGTQETLQQGWTNLVAKVGYDKTREWHEGMLESFIAGAGSGGAIGGISTATVKGLSIIENEALQKGVDPMELGFLKEQIASTIIDSAKRIDLKSEEGFVRISKEEKEFLSGQREFVKEEIFQEKEKKQKAREAKERLLAPIPQKQVVGLIKREVTKTEKVSFKAGRRDVIRKRGALIEGVRERFDLTDAELKKIIKNRNIGIMPDKEFKIFIDRVRKEAPKFAERRQAFNELQAHVKEKELDVSNLRKSMKLPTFKNMTTNQIVELDKALEPFQKGDEFLSVRKLETVDRTELKGIKTWREARERLAKKLDVPLEKLSNIKVSELDRFRFDTALAEKNDFYKMMVEEVSGRIMTSEAGYLKQEEEVFKLAKELKPKGIIAKAIPQQKIIKKYMEAPIDQKQAIAEQMTEAEMAIASYMTKEFEKARDYLIEIEAMNMGRENYFVHIRRGILEAVKEDGWVQAAKELFIKHKMEEQNFNILDRETGEVLALDKFFKFAMHRTGKLRPTENTVKAFLQYMKIFKKKQALDEIVPLIDIYAHSLTPKGMTKSGIMLHGNLIKFVKEYLNTKKGRHVTLIAKQGGKIDRAIRAGVMLTALRDLGLNLPVSIATEIGEQVTTYQLLGKKNYLKGKLRQNTKQGKKIIEKYRNFIGKNPWAELVEPARDIGERFLEGIFVLFKDASVRSNKTFLLGSLTSQEFQSGELSPVRLASLRTELGRYRQVEGSKSILGATPEGAQYSQYKRWAIPILRTTIKNLNNISVRLLSKKVSGVEKRKSALELYRIVESTAFVLAIKAFIGGDDEDKSFVGKLKSKAYRESMTLIQALNPKMFVAAGRLASFSEDLASNLYLIGTLEKYKTTGPGYKKGELKGVRRLKKQFKPVVISQFEGEPKKEKYLPTKSEFKRATKKKRPLLSDLED